MTSFPCILLSLYIGDEDALNKLVVVHPETLSRVDDRGWIPLHEAAAQENKRILEIIFSGSHIIKSMIVAFDRLIGYTPFVTILAQNDTLFGALTSVPPGCRPVSHSKG